MGAATLRAPGNRETSFSERRPCADSRENGSPDCNGTMYDHVPSAEETDADLPSGDQLHHPPLAIGLPPSVGKNCTADESLPGRVVHPRTNRPSGETSPRRGIGCPMALRRFAPSVRTRYTYVAVPSPRRKKMSPSGPNRG